MAKIYLLYLPFCSNTEVRLTWTECKLWRYF